MNNRVKKLYITLCLFLGLLCGISRAGGINDSSDFDSKAQEVLLNLGIKFLEKGFYDEALVQFNKIIKINPKNADAYYNRAYVFLHYKNYQLAFWDYSKTIQLDPSRASAYYNRGLIGDTIKASSKQAINDFSRALTINPSLYEAYYCRAAAYMKEREYELAIIDCDRFIQANGESGMAYNQRAIANYYKGDKETALRDAEKAESLGYKIDPLFRNKIYREM